MLEEISHILASSVLVTGLVIVMMMMIECFNVWSKGRLTKNIQGAGPLQVVISALLGAVPGCMGGFAVVSLYTHGMVSFGALIAMMIASSGDEAFVMLAMIPRQALIITASLAVLAIVAGLVVDAVYHPARKTVCCEEGFGVHGSEETEGGKRHFGWKRTVILVGVCVFLAALCLGFLEDEGGEAPEAEYMFGGINLLSEDWMNWMFALFAVGVIAMTLFASDHFVEEHLWHHVICEHLPKIFLWTAGTLVAVATLFHYIDISGWISSNTLIMILIAAAIGIIPESGPHMVFVTMFASGIIPLPVLVASCISQDGHAALPLLAEDRKSFILAKSLNFIIAVAAGLTLMLFQ